MEVNQSKVLSKVRKSYERFVEWGFGHASFLTEILAIFMWGQGSNAEKIDSQNITIYSEDKVSVPLKDLKIHYTTFGTPLGDASRKISNAVLQLPRNHNSQSLIRPIKNRRVVVIQLNLLLFNKYINNRSCVI